MFGATLRFTSNNVNFLLWRLACMDLGNADLVGQVTHFGFPVPRNDHDAIKEVLGAEVADERRPFGPGFVSEPQRRRVPIVNCDHAFHPPLERRNRLLECGALGKEPLSTGDLYGASPDNALETLSRRFPNFRGFGEEQTLRSSRFRYGAAQRMFGIAFQAGDKSQHFVCLEFGGRNHSS